MDLINRFNQYSPLFKPYTPIITKYIRKLEFASLSLNKTTALNVIEEGVKNIQEMLPKLRFNPTLYNMAKSAPAAGEGLMKQIKQGTRDTRDINTALGIFYYKMRAILPQQGGTDLRINLLKPKGPKGPKSPKGSKGPKSPKGPK